MCASVSMRLRLRNALNQLENGHPYQPPQSHPFPPTKTNQQLARLIVLVPYVHSLAWCLRVLTHVCVIRTPFPTRNSFEYVRANILPKWRDSFQLKLRCETDWHESPRVCDRDLLKHQPTKASLVFGRNNSDEMGLLSQVSCFWCTY